MYRTLKTNRFCGNFQENSTSRLVSSRKQENTSKMINHNTAIIRSGLVNGATHNYVVLPVSILRLPVTRRKTSEVCDLLIIAQSFESFPSFYLILLPEMGMSMLFHETCASKENGIQNFRGCDNFNPPIPSFPFHAKFIPLWNISIYVPPSISSQKLQRIISFFSLLGPLLHFSFSRKLFHFLSNKTNIALHERLRWTIQKPHSLFSCGQNTSRRLFFPCWSPIITANQLFVNHNTRQAVTYPKKKKKLDFSLPALFFFFLHLLQKSNYRHAHAESNDNASYPTTLCLNYLNLLFSSNEKFPRNIKKCPESAFGFEMHKFSLFLSAILWNIMQNSYSISSGSLFLSSKSDLFGSAPVDFYDMPFSCQFLHG